MTQLTSNRSMQDVMVIPVLHYPDVAIAAAWLCQAFGFAERLRIGDHRIQLDIAGGAGAVVVAQRPKPTPPCPHACHSIMVRITDIDQHYQRALAASARSLSPPTGYPFGERQYSVADPGGHIWTFSQTVADVDPAAWGGVLSQEFSQVQIL
jgi:uncharacterized glyoxalase superfamily protein PhnB